ncbi:alpha/beta fold hydrolase [bacterium]|nr:alpha/beta fold hydrolase [bacterium]
MGSFAVHAGCRIAYDRRGTGPAVLFIQGVGVHGDGWLPQVEALSDTFTCLTFDNRGTGRSQPAGGPITVEQMAADALAVLDAEGLHSAHVVGHSLGGLVAVFVALAARERVKSLALLCTFADGRAAAPLTYRMVWLGMRSRVGTRAMRRRGFAKLIYPPGRDTDADFDRLTALFGHDLGDTPAVVGPQLVAMRRASALPRLAELAGIPTLVANAAHDPIAPPRVGRPLADGIPGARYIEFPDASHGLPITHAAATNGLLREHLEAVR